MAYNKMEKKEKYETAASDFTALLYSKGYRGKFTLYYPYAGAPQIMGNLSECLNKMIAGFENTNGTKPFFELETYAGNGRDKHCHFKMYLDEVKGFLVDGMIIKDRITKQNKQYDFMSNHQVPGSVAVQGLFPKPKPWERIIKGRFRP